MRFNLAASAIKNLFSALLSLAILSCANAQESQISVSVWPEFGLGGPDRLTHVAGRVQGVDFSDKAIYLFAEADRLYKQPLAETRNIPIAKSGFWQSPTHLGRRYHVILAAKYYNPPGILMNIPRPEGAIHAVATLEAPAKLIFAQRVSKGTPFEHVDPDAEARIQSLLERAQAAEASAMVVRGFGGELGGQKVDGLIVWNDIAKTVFGGSVPKGFGQLQLGKKGLKIIEKQLREMEESIFYDDSVLVVFWADFNYNLALKLR